MFFTSSILKDRLLTSYQRRLLMVLLENTSKLKDKMEKAMAIATETIRIRNLVPSRES